MRSVSVSVPVSGASIRLRVAECEGTPLVLLHGGPGGTDYLYKFFAPRVRGAGYRPVGMIQRGCTGSPSDGPFTVDANIEDVEAVRAYLGAERVALLGHSWGGLLAACCTARYPERIERLLLVCPIGPRAGWLDAFRAEIVRRLTAEELRRIAFLDEEARHTEDPEVVARLMVARANIQIAGYYSPRHRENKPGLAAMTWHVRKATMDSLEAWYWNREWESGFAALRCPAALIYGKDDPIPEQAVRDYADMVPGLHIAALERCGHFPWFEEPDAFWEAFDAAIRV